MPTTFSRYFLLLVLLLLFLARSLVKFGVSQLFALRDMTSKSNVSYT